MCSILAGFVQAKQVRKASYVPEAGGDYNPDAQPSCTVYAGTLVHQVIQLPWLPLTYYNAAACRQCVLI
jgi:hypothetical protein